MILFRCECGEAHSVDDRYTGGTAECQACGRKLAIPEESDADVVLVYSRSTESGSGIAVSRDRIPEQLKSGDLDPTDLILDSGGWMPLSTEFMNSMVGELPAADTSQPVLTVRELVGDAGGEAKSRIVKVPLIDMTMGNGNVDGGAVPAPPSTARRGRKSVRRGRLRARVVVAFVGVLAVTVLYDQVLGPLTSKWLNRATTIMVRNRRSQSVTLRYGWGGREKVAGRSMSTVKMHVGLWAVRYMHIVPVGNGESEKEAMTVFFKLRPLKTVLVTIERDAVTVRHP